MDEHQSLASFLTSSPSRKIMKCVSEPSEQGWREGV